MIPIFHRNWYTEAYRLDDGNILAQASYLDTYTEKTARLYLTRVTLEIYHAEVATYREGSEEVTKPLVVLPEINGLRAYFGVGKSFRTALPDNQLLLDLMTEAVKAVIQGEIFFHQEMGFPTVKDHDDYWDQTLLNACAYYSNLEDRTIRFGEYAKQQARDTKLFCRHQRYSVFQRGIEQHAVLATFCDAFHEMAVAFQLSGPKHVVSEASGGILRSPDRICLYSLDTLKKLYGKSMLDNSTAKICGGTDGCAHLSHMVMEATRSLELALTY